MPHHILKHRILTQGPLTIADFMAEALGVYYSTQDPFGEKGDFTTAPEISQLFGEMLGVWCAYSWQQMGCPAQLSLVELGPGRGTLMLDIMRATRKVAGFHAALTIHMVETSPTLQKQQQQLLSGYNTQFHTSFSAVPEGNFILVANEFFDALPIHQYHKTSTGWKERRVALSADTDAFCFVLAPLASPINTHLEQEHPHAPLDAIVEISTTSLAIMQEIAARMKHDNGTALIIDYGYDLAGSERVYGDTLQALKAHQFQPVLENIGKADITAHVDFCALKAAARYVGAGAFGAISQQKLLEILGIGVRAEKLLENASPTQKNAIISGLRRLTSPLEMGELFKAISINSPSLPQPIGFTE